MLLRLDPRLPLVWRSTEQLQLGVDHPVATIDRTDRPALAVLEALRRGAPLSTLESLAVAAGGTRSDAADVLALVADALEANRALVAGRLLPRDPAVLICGDGFGARRIGELLHDLGITVTTKTGDDCTVDKNTLVIIVDRYAVAPSRAVTWMSRGIAHLPVAFSDTSIHCGPVIVPGVSACLSCLNEHRIDADSSWPAIASQLFTRPAASETELGVLFLAPQLVNMVCSFASAEPETAQGALLAVDATTGFVTTRAIAPHVECACHQLLLPRTETAVVPPSVTTEKPPTEQTTATADPVLA